jgi:hypothetical protein
MRRRLMRMFMRRPGENAAARYQRQNRDANQRKPNVCKRHGVPPSHAPFIPSKVTHSSSSQHARAFRSRHFQLFSRLVLRID